MRFFNTRSKKQTTPLRSQSGIQLVECMVALVVISFVASVVMMDWAHMMVMTIKGQNQVIASDIAQEVIDNARNSPFQETNSGAPNYNAALLNNVGHWNLVMNSTASSPAAPNCFPRPLLMNESTLGANFSTYAKTGAFNGTAAEDVVNNGDGTVTVTCTVRWSDPSGGGGRKLVASTVIAQNGIHN